ncbi:DUF262 domain-containing protein [Cytobacillus horneckiae]|uniref:DUF262 domain-containing protein n=1 Tax=Cytobacillus horneckiae TaxID=549687 RepID=A0A2N0ZAW4_9BACI|nr:DUF262 domain-containing protein [Cytobacillus horneckiae]MEC1158735.1 DUF262 domain-containing protein [Cytobacillus horneckiae]NRG47440.1 DUF262 domain-containing protein [Bacillus sp. CRN 9]PKG26657.1 DUF262 domain-containing protein [Cytobacillus horneckiae]
MALEFTTVSWSIKQMLRMIERETITFDYPIQRAEGQWKGNQSSLLMDSLSRNYPIPALYFVGDKEEILVEKKGKQVPEKIVIRSCLDGKQRLTNIRSFIIGEFSLDTNLKDVKVDGIDYELAGKTFDELDEVIQDLILSRTLLTYTIDGELVTDEEIEDLLYRLNNGTPMTLQQKSKALMGIEWASTINKLGNHPFIHELAAFSKTQLRTEGHITALVQTMMMLDKGFEYKNVTQSVISEYMQSFRTDSESKMELLEKVRGAMDYLTNVLTRKESTLLRKIHFPMVLMTAIDAQEQNIEHDQFAEWMMYFKEAIKPQQEQTIIEEYDVPTNYREFMGSGSTDKSKAIGRLNEMKRHMKEYVKIYFGVKQS